MCRRVRSHNGLACISRSVRRIGPILLHASPLCDIVSDDTHPTMSTHLLAHRAWMRGATSKKAPKESPRWHDDWQSLTQDKAKWRELETAFVEQGARVKQPYPRDDTRCVRRRIRDEAGCVTADANAPHEHMICDILSAAMWGNRKHKPRAWLVAPGGHPSRRRTAIPRRLGAPPAPPHVREEERQRLARVVTTPTPSRGAAPAESAVKATRASSLLGSSATEEPRSARARARSARSGRSLLHGPGDFGRSRCASFCVPLWMRARARDGGEHEGVGTVHL